MHMGLNALALTDIVGTLEPARFLNTLTTIVMVYLIALGGLRQPVVFTHTVRAALEGVGDDDRGARRDKYARSGLCEERRREIWKVLQHLLQTDRVHLDPELDLPGLARRLQIRPQELSETINTEYRGTFYELINSHRIEAARQLLEQPGAGRRKMLDIALSVGFNSLSTFYSHFRKFTGTTPTEYRARNRRRAGVPA
jgi:AraC-like DNA-binding protein